VWRGLLITVPSSLLSSANWVTYCSNIFAIPTSISFMNIRNNKGPNHACNFLWRSVKGLGVARRRISRFPLTCVVALTLALPCDCVIYNSRTLRISGSRVSVCRRRYHNENAYWTAGHRIDPSRNTPFIWRMQSTDTNSETVSQMSYTNWISPSPDYTGPIESCVHLLSGRSYRWNDIPCSLAYCSICELDI